MGNVDVRSTKTVPTMVQGVGQRSPVVMTRAGPRNEISAAVYEAVVSVAAAPAHVAVADLLGIHSNDARVAGKRKEADAVNVAD